MFGVGEKGGGERLKKERKIKIKLIHNKEISNNTLVEIFTKKIYEQGFDKYKEK